MKIDLKLWNEARLDIEKQIRELKQVIRKESKGEASSTLWSALLSMKRTATRLYRIRATANGKDHGGYIEDAGEFAIEIKPVSDIAA